MTQKLMVTICIQYMYIGWVICDIFVLSIFHYYYLVYICMTIFFWHCKPINFSTFIHTSMYSIYKCMIQGSQTITIIITIGISVHVLLCNNAV